MSHSVIDTNVPLTAAGYNSDASARCRAACEVFIERVLLGEVVAVIDDEFAALDEYKKKVPPHGRSEDYAGRFLIHLYQNQGNESFVRMLALSKSSTGELLDYPDTAGAWATNNPRCKQFDEDDKKWVALAVRFKAETGADATIVNAGDRCWRAFETHLSAAGLLLDFLCADAATPTPTDAPG